MMLIVSVQDCAFFLLQNSRNQKKTVICERNKTIFTLSSLLHVCSIQVNYSEAEIQIGRQRAERSAKQKTGFCSNSRRYLYTKCDFKWKKNQSEFDK